MTRAPRAYQRVARPILGRQCAAGLHKTVNPHGRQSDLVHLVNNIPPAQPRSRAGRRLQQAVEAEARVVLRLAHVRRAHKLQGHAVLIAELIEFDVSGPRTSSHTVFPQKQTLLQQLVQAQGSSQVAGGQLKSLSWLEEDTDFFK